MISCSNCHLFSYSIVTGVYHGECVATEDVSKEICQSYFSDISIVWGMDSLSNGILLSQDIIRFAPFCFRRELTLHLAAVGPKKQEQF